MQTQRPLMNAVVNRLRIVRRGRVSGKQQIRPAPAPKVFSFSDSSEKLQDSTHQDPEEVIVKQGHTKLQDSTKEESSPAVEDEPAPASKPQKSVSFSNVEVREYGLTLGDNPFPEGGFPLAIDWKYNDQTQVYDLSDHESLRDQEGRRRSIDMEGLTTHERRLWLRSMGYTEAELRQAERRRKVQEAQEWAYGKNQKDIPPFVNNRFLDRYIR